MADDTRASAADGEIRTPTAVKIEGPEIAYDGFFKLEKYKVSYELYNGGFSKEQTIEVAERGDSVAALLFDPDKEAVILVEQFRFPTHRKSERGNGWLIETPAGMIKEGESKVDCVKREVEEETGYKIRDMRLIARFFSSPGGTSERIFLYYAEVHTREGTLQFAGSKTGEDIRIIRYGFDEFSTRLMANEFEDPKVIIAGHWLRNVKANERIKVEDEPETVEFRVTGTDKIIGFKTGSILDVKGVDVWVNPEDTDMIMDRFRGRSVSSAIRFAGAKKVEGVQGRVEEDTIADELRSKLGSRDFVGLREVVETTSGQLKQTNGVKRIFHVAVVPGSIGAVSGSSTEVLQGCVNDVLNAIESSAGGILGSPKYESVLIPILGSGQGGFFNYQVIPLLVKSALNFLKDDSVRVRKIYFSAYSWGDKQYLLDELNAYETKRVIERV